MDRHERHEQTALRAEGHDHRRHQRGDDDVVRGGGKPHPQDETHDRHQDQHQHQVSAGEEFDELADDLVGAGQRDGADDDARRPGGHTDRNHVARPRHHAVEPLAGAAPERTAVVAGAPHPRLERVLRQRNDNHRQRRPECREGRRQPFQHDAPDQDDDRQHVEQPRHRGGSEPGKLDDGRIRWIDHEIRRPRGESQQAEVDRCAQDRHRGEREVRNHDLDPPEPVVHPHAEQRDADESREEADHLVRERHRRRWSRQTLEVELHRLEVHDVHERDIGRDGRDQRVLDDLGVAHPGELRDQERRRAHHRRGELAIGRRGDLDRPRLLGGEAGAFHQRDGERTGGDGIRDRRSGVDAAHGGRHDRRLGRPAAEVAEQRERELDEVVARPRLLENRAEQDEQEDHRRRYPEGDPEDPLGLNPVVPHRLSERRSLPADRIGQHLGVSEEDVAHEDAGDDHQREPERPVHRGPQHDHADARGNEVARSRDPGPNRDIVLEHEEIETGSGPERRQDPVVPGDSAAGARLEQRKCERGEKHRERKMDEAGLIGIDDHVEPGDVGQQERNVRRDVELEQRPDERQSDDETSLPAIGIAASGIDLRHQIAYAGRVAARLCQGHSLPEAGRPRGRRPHVTRESRYRISAPARGRKSANRGRITLQPVLSTCSHSFGASPPGPATETGGLLHRITEITTPVRSSASRTDHAAPTSSPVPCSTWPLPDAAALRASP